MAAIMWQGVTVVFAVICCIGLGPKGVICSQEIPVAGSPLSLDITSPSLEFECGKRQSLVHFEGEKGFTNSDTNPSSNPLPHIWPWTALIGLEKPDGSVDWLCGGVLINRRWVLTAAHCIRSDLPPRVVRLGEHDFSNTNNPFREDIPVRHHYRYPKYSPNSSYDDLGLLELDRPAELKPQISPICLPWGRESLTNMTGRTVAFTGWGLLEFGGEKDPVLQELKLKVIPPSVCDSKYKFLPTYSIQFPHGINQRNFGCARDVSGGQHGCGGLSGSPITYINSNRDHVLAGVMTRGFGCSFTEFPGLSMPLHTGKYLYWIKETAFN